MADRILRKPDVERITNVSDRMLREWELHGTFPKRFTINPGGRAVGWLESEVLAWLEQRAASRE